MSTDLQTNGFAFCKNLFSPNEVERIKQLMESISDHNASFRKTEDLFAIRRFLLEVPYKS